MCVRDIKKYYGLRTHKHAQSLFVSYMDNSGALLEPNAIYLSIALLAADMIKAILKKL